MATITPSAPLPAHTRTELLESVADGGAGFGMAFMSYLGVIPGLIPMVALLLLAGLIVLIPALVVGIVFGLPLLLGRILVRSLSARRQARSARPGGAAGATMATATALAEPRAYTPPARRNTAPVA